MNHTENFTRRFAESTDEELIEFYNQETGKTGWENTRASYLFFLHQEIESRDFDSSLMIHRSKMSLAQKVKLNDGKLIFAENNQNF